MKRKWCAVCWLCLVCLIGSACESRGQNIEYLMKMGHYQAFQAPLFPLLSDSTDLLKGNDVQSRDPKRGKPPLSAGRIVGEILAGGAGGIVVGIAGIAVGNILEPSWGPIVGFATGESVGSAIGVYAVGSISDETGAFGQTLVGGLVGSLVGFVGFIAYHEVYGHGDLEVLPLLIPPPIGATIGFNLTRRYKSPPASETALINFSDGQMSLAIPTIAFQPDPYDGNHLTQSVDLVKVRF